MSWRAKNSDLNPLENVWEILYKKIECKKFKNSDELFKKLHKTWLSLNLEIIEKLVAAMPKRCADIIRAKGGNTNY